MVISQITSSPMVEFVEESFQLSSRSRGSLALVNIGLSYYIIEHLCLQRHVRFQMGNINLRNLIIYKNYNFIYIVLVIENKLSGIAVIRLQCRRTNFRRPALFFEFMSLIFITFSHTFSPTFSPTFSLHSHLHSHYILTYILITFSHTFSLHSHIHSHYILTYILITFSPRFSLYSHLHSHYILTYILIAFSPTFSLHSHLYSHYILTYILITFSPKF